LTSNSSNIARSQLIKTRHGTWIDKSLLPAARRECLDALREAARKAVGEATYLPGWISDATDSVECELQELSWERLRWRPTPAEVEMAEELDATIDALQDRGALDKLGFWERMDLESQVAHRIRSKYECQVSHEVEEARKKNHPPKSNPTLITEEDILSSTLDVLHRRGVLDEIDLAAFSCAPLEEVLAWELAREARKTARWCGCCGRELTPKEPAHFGADVYVGMLPLRWYRVRKPVICKLLYERTVLCGSCAPEWLSLERDDVVTQLCANCERSMVSRLDLSSLQRTFCSDVCRNAYHNQLRKEKRSEERKKICEVCGEVFTATRRDAKTCSERCKQKVYRRRKKEVNQNQ
jgi:hypothetical protein